MSRREGLFPTGSIGRSGINLPRVESHEGLTAHPLLSPPPGPSSVASTNTPTASGSVDAPAVAAPRYVPYTPRQRGAPSPATTTPATGATSHPIPSDRDAANRLQLMHLKAAAQKVGLDAASTGWMILEKFALEADRAQEWNDLWNAVTEGKVSAYQSILVPTSRFLGARAGYPPPASRCAPIERCGHAGFHKRSYRVL